MTTWDEHGSPDDDVDWLVIPVSGYPLPVRQTAVPQGSAAPSDPADDRGPEPAVRVDVATT